MFINGPPDILGHFFLLFSDDPGVELVRVDSGHEHDAVALEVVLGKIRVMPHLDKAILVETDHGVLNFEGAQLHEQFMESMESLAEDVESLLVGQVAGVDQPERYVLGEDSDVFVVGTKAITLIIISAVGPDYRFLSAITIVVSL